MKRGTALLSSVALISLGALAAAWVSQHVYGMQPCPWCVLQRAVFGALAMTAVLGLLVRRRRGALIAVSITGLGLALAGGAAATWQHFVAASQVSCNLTLADKIVQALQLDQAWPGMFSATVSCADAAVRLWGVPYEYWSLALFALLAGMWAWVPRRG